MALHLAMDPATGLTLPNGRIAGIAMSLAALRLAGFAAARYTGTRLTTIDETDSGKWNDDCEPGWYLVAGAVARSRPPTPAEQLAADIARLKALFAREEGESFRELLVREYVDPQVDSGHRWLDDMVNGWIKPWLRLAVVGINAEKARGTPTRAYAPVLAAIQRQVESPGLIGFWGNADKSAWRPLRSGSVAWEYDGTDGGTKAGTSQAVTYPNGLSVATWSARQAVESL